MQRLAWIGLGAFALMGCGEDVSSEGIPTHEMDAEFDVNVRPNADGMLVGSVFLDLDHFVDEVLITEDESLAVSYDGGPLQELEPTSDGGEYRLDMPVDTRDVRLSYTRVTADSAPQTTVSVPPPIQFDPPLDQLTISQSAGATLSWLNPLEQGEGQSLELFAVPCDFSANRNEATLPPHASSIALPGSFFLLEPPPAAGICVRLTIERENFGTPDPAFDDNSDIRAHRTDVFEVTVVP